VSCRDCRLTRADLARALCPEGGLSDAARNDTNDASVLTWRQRCAFGVVGVPPQPGA
jgi:hypothetical protein